jgi:magnesium-transporting ATPase (P-type)
VLLCTDKTGTLTENKVILATATNHKSIDHNAALAVAGTIALPAPSCPGTPS